MAAPDTEIDMSTWYPTYGVLSAQRVLERYNIRLPQGELIAGLQDPDGPYCYILQVPMRHLYNGIILEQAKDYKSYVQKLLIDYLLSGQAGSSSASETDLQQKLEEQKDKLMTAIQNFESHVFTCDKLIAKSQSALIRLTKSWPDFVQTFKAERPKVDQIVLGYLDLAHKVTGSLVLYRRTFYELIVTVNELLNSSGETSPNPDKDRENRSQLNFDNTLGLEG